MGSFYMSCPVSGLAIRDYAKVKLFFITSSGDTGHCCYPTSLYSFASLGIDAEYADYGQYKIDPTNPEWVEFIRFINEEGLFIEAGENRYHEKEVDPSKFTVNDDEKVFDAIHSGRLRVKHWKNKEGLTVDAYPVDKMVFDDVIMKPFKTWRGDVVTVDKMVEDFKESAFAEHERFMETLKDLLKKDFVSESINQEEYDKEVERLNARDEERYYSVGKSKFHLDEIMHWNAEFGEYILKNGKDYSLAKIAEMRFLWNIHYINHIMVTPQMSGGQETNFEQISDFHSQIAEVARKQNREYKKDMGELDECEDCTAETCDGCTV